MKKDFSAAKILAAVSAVAALSGCDNDNGPKVHTVTLSNGTAITCSSYGNTVITSKPKIGDFSEIDDLNGYVDMLTGQNRIATQSYEFTPYRYQPNSNSAPEQIETAGEYRSIYWRGKNKIDASWEAWQQRDEVGTASESDLPKEITSLRDKADSLLKAAQKVCGLNKDEVKNDLQAIWSEKDSQESVLKDIRDLKERYRTKAAVSAVKSSLLMSPSGAK